MRAILMKGLIAIVFVGGSLNAPAQFQFLFDQLSRYQIVNGSFTWHEAKRDAERRGGHLAVITTTEEWTHVVQLHGRKLLGVFLGATDEHREGDWKWITGEPWLFDKWARRQPDNSSLVQHYLWLHPAYGTAWDDVDADVRSGYLLEIENRYTIVEGGYTWHEAKADAELRGGHLVTIDKFREWLRITAFLGDSLSRHSAPLWMGAANDNPERMWKWVTGEEWQIVSEPWGIGEPSRVDNAGNPENYLQWQGATLGGWNDAIATDRRGYILEIETSSISPLGLSFPVKLKTGSRVLTFVGIPNGKYLIQSSDDVSKWIDWTYFVAGSSGNTFFDATTTNSSFRFYRVTEAPNASIALPSIAGRLFTITIHDGSSPFAATGAYQFKPTVTNTYSIVPQSDSVAASSGTYTYVTTDATKGTISFSDSRTGEGIAELSFITPVTGSFVISRPQRGGGQVGTFMIE